MALCVVTRAVFPMKIGICECMYLHTPGCMHICIASLPCVLVMMVLIRTVKNKCDHLKLTVEYYLPSIQAQESIWREKVLFRWSGPTAIGITVKVVCCRIEVVLWWVMKVVGIKKCSSFNSCLGGKQKALIWRQVRVRKKRKKTRQYGLPWACCALNCSASSRSWWIRESPTEEVCGPDLWRTVIVTRHDVKRRVGCFPIIDSGVRMTRKKLSKLTPEHELTLHYIGCLNDE
jgi:hypothetical protein